MEKPDFYLDKYVGLHQLELKIPQYLPYLRLMIEDVAAEAVREYKKTLE